MRVIISAALIVSFILSSCGTGNESGKMRLIEFISSNCPTCEEIKSSVENIKAKYKNDLIVEIYNINSEKGSKKASDYGVKKTPSFVFLDSFGIEYFRLENYIQQDVIEALINAKLTESAGAK
ncbi:MAG TPA: thioredoxin family protein [Candidatus Goldiibacteriota bacterium]|nr:thioredoxin family protein [Candidatus Goldiibacteriota bacterium]